MRKAKLNLSSWYTNPTHLKLNQQDGTELLMRQSDLGYETEGKAKPDRKRRLRGILSKAEGY